MLFRDFLNSLIKNYILRYIYYIILIILLIGNYYSFLDNFFIKIFVLLLSIVVSTFINVYYLKKKFFNDFLIIKFFFKQNNLSIITNYIIFYIKYINNLINYFKTSTFDLVWKPLYKKNGYFLYYRSNRTIWSNTRTEENNNIKVL